EATWDLSVLYKGFDDPALRADILAITTMTAEGQALLQADLPQGEKLVQLVSHMEALSNKLSRAFLFCQLTLAVEAENRDAFRTLEELSALSVDAQVFRSACTRFIGELDGLEALIQGHEKLRQNAFVLREAQQEAKHMLPESMEKWMLRMSLSGGDAFQKLRDQLMGTLTVDFQGHSLPLPAVRGKAYDPDPAVRKAAYEAELAAYPKVALPMAFCLGGIKGEALTMSEARGYADVLTQQLAESRMDRETLDAMFTAIREALPDFRRYLKAKAKLLGHEGGIPFYDLFAPVGQDVQTYTIEEARALLTDAFGKAHPKMATFIAHAFDHRWIDLYPREGKEGGAFCSENHELRISRIMTNFVGSFSDVSTLAHELGHAWHARCLEASPLLMAQPPMPLAETASTFNETMLAQTVLETATPQRAFNILEGILMEATQCCVDILSRFLFESAVFEARKTHTPSVEELRQMMLAAQEEAYGDGLAADVRHADMWINKGHYYTVGLHFYNFPYAFGLLFGLGVYQLYRQEGQAFLPKYDALLAYCGSDTIANVAATVGIDVRSAAYWRSALDVVRGEIDQFVALAEQQAAR
ncbi:MAG: M3 family oligoendopeptidase, partial [Candidatus Limiplasma sp.]|nr:M3 family oligoendopeptidase [Candidatus Limiplasma sp.]